MAAKTEFEDAAKAKSYFAEADLQFALDPIQSDRAISYQRGEPVKPVKIDFNLPQNYTTFKPDIPTKGELSGELQQLGYVHPIGGEVSEGFGDEFIAAEKWRQLFEQPGIRGSQDWRGAGGGMVGIRKPNAIAPTGGPMAQGLRSLYINDRNYKEYKWQI